MHRSTARQLTPIAALALLASQAARAVDVTWLDVGDAGNAPAFNGFGGVDYEYSIAETEVTNGQYAEFLNTVDPDGANLLALYNPDMTSNSRGGIDFVPGNAPGFKYQPKASFAERPVNYVSWFDAARFANWLHNGQGTFDTEIGSYDLMMEATRGAEATVVLPSDDEWFKAAYYQPGKPYWLYPTWSDTAPTTAVVGSDGVVTNPGPGTANWNSDTTVSVVGSAGGRSYYGTFDQAGNVSEWTESIFGLTMRGDKGGSWVGGAIRADDFGAVNTPTSESSTRGFRLALVPEPGRWLLSLTAIGALLSARRGGQAERAW